MLGLAALALCSVFYISAFTEYTEKVLKGAATWTMLLTFLLYESPQYFYYIIPLSVLLATLVVTAWGVWSVTRTPIDALPDLSDVQVIIRTPYPGQAPQIVENQVTYPLTTTMLSVPGAKTVRGYSFFGDSYVYVIFEDGTDLYWARSRVLEYLNQVQSRLPAGVTPCQWAISGT